MFNVIKMDIYRLVTSLYFKICIVIVFLLNLFEAPFAKLIFNLTVKLLESVETEEDPASLDLVWPNVLHVGNVIADQLGIFCTVSFLICIVIFSYDDIRHGYIKNIAGQLPSRGHTVISKFAVIQLSAIVFYLISIIGNSVGQLVIGEEVKFDMVFSGDFDLETGDFGSDKVFSMGQSFAECIVKILLLSTICALILLLTTGIGSNMAATIAAILFGSGLTGIGYSLASSTISKLLRFEDFALSDYMPDSLYRSDLFAEGRVLQSLITAVILITVLLFVTIKLYSRKEIK